MATQIPQLAVELRGQTGSRYAVRLRKVGKLPAVIYGHKQDPVNITVDRRTVTDLLAKNTHILEVVLEAKTEPVLVKAVQWDHLGAHVIHLDLTRVDLTERVTVNVPLQLIGEAEGLKEEGAILEHPVAMVPVECLATQIPERIKVDVAALKLGESLTAKDLKLPEGVVCKLDADTVIATISRVAEEVVEVAAVEGAAAEPEVIGRKLAEGETAEGEAGAAPAAGAKGAAAPKAAAPKAGGEKK